MKLITVLNMALAMVLAQSASAATADLRFSDFAGQYQSASGAEGCPSTLEIQRVAGSPRRLRYVENGINDLSDDSEILRYTIPFRKAQGQTDWGHHKQESELKGNTLTYSYEGASMCQVFPDLRKCPIQERTQLRFRLKGDKLRVTKSESFKDPEERQTSRSVCVYKKSG